MKVSNIFTLLVVFLPGCASIADYADKGYPVCAVQLSVEGNTQHLKYFHKKIRGYINNVAGFPLIASNKPDKALKCNPEYKLHVEIKVTQKYSHRQYKGHTDKYGNTSGQSWDVNYTFYNYEIFLKRKDNNEILFSNLNYKVTGYTSVKKARKWSSKRIAYDLRDAGMLKADIYKKN